MRAAALSRLSALVALSLCASPRPLAAQKTGRFTLTEVKPGVFAAIARPGDASAVGNAGFVVGGEAVLVVDAFATPEAAAELLEAIRRRTPRPVRWLIDTHHHLDHCGGNAVFAEAGAIVVSQENARARMVERARVRGTAAGGKRAALALPTETYRQALSIWLGDRRVDVFTKPGHTDGDSLVSVQDADVLFGGDLLQKDTVPNLSDAKPQEWIRTLDELAVRFPSATLIPGHGAVARPLDMRPLRDYLVTLRTLVARGLQEGLSGDVLAAAVTPGLQGTTRHWSGAEHVGETVGQMERALTGTTTAPEAPTPVP